MTPSSRCPSHVLEPAILPGGRCIYGCRSCGAVEDKSPDRRRFEAEMEKRARPYLQEAYKMGYPLKRQLEMVLGRAA